MNEVNIFSSIKSNKINFGLGIGLQTGYTYYSERPSIFIRYQLIRVHILDLDLIGSINVHKKISKSVSIEFKIIPRLEINPLSSFTVGNPNVSLNAQRQNNSDKFPTVRIGASLHLRYTIADSSKRGRR